MIGDRYALEGSDSVNELIRDWAMQRPESGARGGFARKLGNVLSSANRTERGHRANGPP